MSLTALASSAQQGSRSGNGASPAGRAEPSLPSVSNSGYRPRVPEDEYGRALETALPTSSSGTNTQGAYSQHEETSPQEVPRPTAESYHSDDSSLLHSPRRIPASAKEKGRARDERDSDSQIRSDEARSLLVNPPQTFEELGSDELAYQLPDGIEERLSGEQVSALRYMQADNGNLVRRMGITTTTLYETFTNYSRVNGALDLVRDETTQAIARMRAELQSQHNRVNRILEDNLRTLHDAGINNARINEVIQEMEEGRQQLERAMSPEPPSVSAHRGMGEGTADANAASAGPSALRSVAVPPAGHPVTTMEQAMLNTRAKIASVLPPRRVNETMEAFYNRAEAALADDKGAAGASNQQYAAPTPPAPAIRSTRQSAPAINTPGRENRPRVSFAAGNFSQGREAYGPDWGYDSISQHQQDRRLHPTEGFRNPASAFYPASTIAGRVGNRAIGTGPQEEAYAVHGTAMLDRIFRLIQHKVGRERNPLPPGAKLPKIDLPDKYSGGDDHEAFVQWLSSFLNWLVAHIYCGPDMDEHRVQMLGQVVRGTAKDWYCDTIDNPENMRPYSFAEAIMSMHERFVRTASARRTTTTFDNCRFSTSKGTEQFASDIMKFAKRMIEHPTDYEIRRKFLYGLPEGMRRELIKYRGVSAEYSTLHEMRVFARQWEEAEELARDGGKPAAQSSSTSKPTTSSNPRPDQTPRRHGRPDPPRNQGRFQPRRPGNNTPSGNAQSGPAGNRDGQGRFRPQGQGKPTTRPDNSGGNKKPFVPTCYRCGGTGHISTDPSCPDYGKPRDTTKPRFHAQRVTGDEHEATSSTEEPWQDDTPADNEDNDDFEGSWGGSQYESELIPLDSASANGAEYTAPEGEGEDKEDNEVRMNFMRMSYMRIDTSDFIDEYADMPDLVAVSDSEEEDDSPLSMIDDAGNVYHKETEHSEGLSDRRDPRATPEDAADLSPEKLSSPSAINDDTTERKVCHPRGTPDEVLSGVVGNTHCTEDIMEGLFDPEETGSHHSYPSRTTMDDLPDLLDMSDSDDEDTSDPDHSRLDQLREFLRGSRIENIASIKRRNTDPRQPKRDPNLQATLSAEILVNGVKAFALFDSGSTTDSISPEFAHATRAPRITLSDQVVLQLGCVGSRSKINYGTRVPVEVGPVKEQVYFDIVNLDRYDCVVGTPFMNKNGLCLDFGRRCIRVGSSEIKAFAYEEEIALVKKRGDDKAYKSIPRETAPLKRNTAPGREEGKPSTD
jgi:hypothetical protein